MLHLDILLCYSDISPNPDLLQRAYEVDFLATILEL
jgi:hypothetical protein